MKHRPLVALSSAAILAVYAAGYERTRSAADRFAAEAAPRRTAAGAPPNAEVVVAPPALPKPNPALQIPPFNATRRPAPDAAPPPSTTAVAPVASEPAPAPSSEPTIESPVVQAARPESAVEAAPAVQAPAPPVATTEYKDGTYLGWGYCRHGDIQASVVIENGRIASATIARCLTRYSCSWIEHLPGQVAARQSADVDYVSGATESSDAFSQAVVEALSKAK
jgi:uncharacterized protein with FMN-binding domain